eukprot:636975-Rhodomonas_salina.4
MRVRSTLSAVALHSSCNWQSSWVCVVICARTHVTCALRSRSAHHTNTTLDSEDTQHQSDSRLCAHTTPPRQSTSEKGSKLGPGADGRERIAQRRGRLSTSGRGCASSGASRAER